MFGTSLLPLFQRLNVTVTRWHRLLQTACNRYQMAGAVEHQAALLLESLGWYKPHVGPGDCLANGLCISRIVLLPLE